MCQLSSMTNWFTMTRTSILFWMRSLLRIELQGGVLQGCGVEVGGTVGDRVLQVWSGQSGFVHASLCDGLTVGFDGRNWTFQTLTMCCRVWTWQSILSLIFLHRLVVLQYYRPCTTMHVMLVASILFYFVYLFVFLYHYYYYSYFGFYSFCVLELVFKIFETIRGRKVSFIEDLFGRRNGVTVLSVIRMALGWMSEVMWEMITNLFLKVSKAI